MAFVSKQKIAHEIIYQLMQYRDLAKANIATTSISMFSSILIIIHYIILRHKDLDKANRVSLRCVFLASWMNMIDSIFDLSTILVSGDTAFCRSSAIITMFARVMSCTLLSLVGINLVLVFVMNIRPSTARRIEWGYYLGAFIYALITVSVPISEEVKSALDPESPLRCYYHIYYYQLFGHSSLLWMWYYSFLFLTTFVATLCSITASIKLMHEHHNFLNRFSNIEDSPESSGATDNHIQIRITNHSGVFTKVVSRCVLYPLVPFISNIWGFIAQLIIVSGSTPSFTLSVIDNVFGCLQGFFVAIIFFSDPAMSEFILQGFQSWKRKKSVESTSKNIYRDSKRSELLSSSNNDNANVSNNTKDDDLQISEDNFLQIPPLSFNSKEFKKGSSKTTSRSQSSTSLCSFYEGHFMKEDHRGSYYDDSATIVVPMRRLEIPMQNNEEAHLTSSPASTYGGSTINFPERRGSSLI